MMYHSLPTIANTVSMYINGRIILHIHRSPKMVDTAEISMDIHNFIKTLTLLGELTEKVVPSNAIKIRKNRFRQMQQIPMTSPPAVGYPTPDPQWLHRQQQISRMAQVHHAHQERAATPWAMNPYALNQSKFLRVVQTQAILFLKSMSERVGSDIQRLCK